MNELVTVKEVFPVLTVVASAVASAVSAYWMARRSASSETLEVERQVAELRRAVSVLKVTAVTDREVRSIVANSLDVIESILRSIEKDAKSNSIEMRQLLIEIAMIKTRLDHVEDGAKCSRPNTGPC